LVQVFNVRSLTKRLMTPKDEVARRHRQPRPMR